LGQDALGWLTAFEAKYSRFLPDSLIARINAAAGREPVAVDAEADALFALCDQLWFLTRGILDPTAGPLVRLWDWKTGRVPGEAELAAALALVGWRKVQRQPGRIFLPQFGMALDLGGMGKEYAVDQLVLRLVQGGATGVLVDLGADVRVHGVPPDGRPAWKIGLENPQRPGAAWADVVLSGGAVATSGDYVRAFEAGGRRFGHILDPRTGRPVDNGLRAVHVLAPSCTQAGMLSTAAFVLGPDEGRKLLETAPGAEGSLVTAHGHIATSRFHEHLAS
jgi:FAD:protein FMN transferase